MTLAENLGYKSFTTIQKWEDGTASPSIYNAKRVAEILGVTIEQLVSDEDNWTTEELKEIKNSRLILGLKENNKALDRNRGQCIRL